MEAKSSIARRLFYVPWLWLGAFGVDGAKLVYGLRGFPSLVRDYLELRRQLRGCSDGWKPSFSRPCLHDRYKQSGTATGHYFHQDLLVARRIFERKPQRHMDVGSSVTGFVAHLAVFRKVEVLDIRPLTTSATNILFRQCDLMNMPAEYEAACDSLSCLHALEHFGLGRYSDRVDAEGHVKGLANLSRMLRAGGTLYLSVPIGEQRIEFNAHRVFAVGKVLSLLESDFELVDFSYVDDSGELHESVKLDAAMVGSNLCLQYGCGIFECRKR